MMRRGLFQAGLLVGFLAAASVVRGDGGYFIVTEVGQAADLAQTRQDVIMAFYEAAPNPDECADAVALPTPEGSYAGTLAYATASGVADCAAAADLPDVWYSYKAAADGTATFVLTATDGQGVPLATALPIYSACPENGGDLLLCEDSAAITGTDLPYEVSLPVAAGTTYWARVAGLADTNYVLSVSFDSSPAADACADAPVAVADLRNHSTTVGATNDGAVDCAGTGGSPDVWYRYVPDRDGQVVFRLIEIDAAAQPVGMGLSIHSGCPGTNDNVLACIDDFPRPELDLSEIPLEVTAGATYFIRIAHPSASGGDRFNLWVDTGDGGQNAGTNAPPPVPYVTYVLSSDYTGNPSEFAWVVPLPATPTDVVAHETGAVFKALDEATRPTFMISSYGGGGGGGCGCAAAGGGGGFLSTNGVEVEASGQAGVFEWAALTSTGSGALLDWLDQHAYAVDPDAERILDDYIEQGRHFLAVRVREPAEIRAGGGGWIEIPPLQFTCQTAERFYPMVISQVSAAEDTEVRLYMLAEHRAQAANLWNVTIDPAALTAVPHSDSGTNYEALFMQAIADRGGLALITEYAGTAVQSWPEAPQEVQDLPFLTRLRTVIRRGNMTRDFEFEDAPTDDLVSPDFWVSSGPEQTAAQLGGHAAAVLLVFGLFRAAVAPRRRGKRVNRQSVQRSTILLDLV